MYNSYIKREYLSSVNQSQFQFEVMLFNKLDKFEKEKECDIAQVNLDDIILILRQIYNKHLELKYRALLSIMNYKIWYSTNVDSGINSCFISDEYFELLKDAEEIKSSMVSSPFFMNKYLDSIFETVETNTIDNIYRCAVWLVYIGINENDLVDIQINDVDLFKRIITVKGKEYKIIDEAFSSINSCVKESSFLVKLGGIKGGEEFIDRKYGSQLLRNSRNNSPTDQAFLKSLKDTFYKRSLKSRYAKQITFSTIRTSGMFYRIRKAELEEGISPDLSCLYGSAATKCRKEYEYYLWCLAGTF